MTLLSSCDSECFFNSELSFSEALLGPLVLFHDLSLFLGSEIVLDIEELADLRDGAVLDQRGDLSAGELQEGLDIEVVGGQDKLEQDLLVEVHELGIPGGGHIVQVVGAQGLLDLRWRVISIIKGKLRWMLQ